MKKIKKIRKKRFATFIPSVLIPQEMLDLIDEVVYSKNRYATVSDFIRYALFNQLLKEGVVTEKDRERLVGW